MKNTYKAIILAATGAVGLSGALVAFAADPVSPATVTSPAPEAVTAPAQAWAGDHPDANRHHGGRAARRFRMRRLMNRLGLTDAQRAQVRHLHAQAMVDVWSARADGSLTVDQLHARVRAAFKAQHDGFRSLLTDEQRAQLDQIKGPSVGHS